MLAVMSTWHDHSSEEDAALGMAIIGAGVRAGRLRLSLTQQRLGARVGVSQSAISRLETGTLQGLRLRTLARIVGVLQTAPGSFAFPDGPADPPPLKRAQIRRLRRRYG